MNYLVSFRFMVVSCGETYFLHLCFCTDERRKVDEDGRFCPNWWEGYRQKVYYIKIKFSSISKLRFLIMSKYLCSLNDLILLWTVHWCTASSHILSIDTNSLLLHPCQRIYNWHLATLAIHISFKLKFLFCNTITLRCN